MTLSRIRPKAGSDPIIDLPCGLPTRFDSGRDAGQCGIVWAVGREYERIPPGADGCECLILGPSKLPFPFPSVHGPSSIEPDPGKPVLLREGDLSRGYRRARTGDADNPLGRGGPELLAWLVEQACGLPMSNQSILQALRTYREDPVPAVFPNQSTGRGKRLAVSDIDRHDLGPLGAFFLQPCDGFAALQGKIID